MKISHAIEGLKIFAKYDKLGEQGFLVAAEHDVLYGSTQDPGAMTDVDLFVLDALGWEWDEDVEAWMGFV
jgi:hypothetical protein